MLVDVRKDVHQVLREVVRVLRDLVRDGDRVEAGDVEDVEEQDGGVRDGGASGLGDDVRVRDVRLGEQFADGLDDVDAVFVDGVVAAVLVVRVGAVVVDGEAAAEVEVAHRRAFLHEADVDAARLLHAGPDVADVRDLGADVVMEKAEAVEHVLFLEVVDELHELGGVQPEHAAVAA